MQLRLKLYGPFEAALSDGTPLAQRSAKEKALLALLATSPDNQRSRKWLQEMLWSRSGPELGRASLRQLLGSLRRTLGDHFPKIFDVQHDRVAMHPAAINLIGHPSDGDFLDGLDVKEDAFEDWRRAVQASQAQSTHGEAAVLRNLLPTILVICPVLESSVPEAAAIADTIAHQITRTLSHSKLFFVISHLSSRTLNPNTIELADVEERFAANYVVMSRLRSEGQTTFLEIELFENSSGRILQSCAFECPTVQFSERVAEFAVSTTAMIGKAILSRSIEMTATLDLPAIGSHALMMSSLILMNKMSRTHFSKARSLLEELVRRRPRHAELEAWLGQWHLLNVSQGWSEDPAHDKQLALEWSRRAMDLNPLNPIAQIIHANIQNLLFCNFDDARIEFEDALETNPNIAFGWLVKSMLEAFTDNGAVAVKCAQRANDLSPMDPRTDFFHSLTATAYLSDANFEQALHFANLSLARNRFHASTQRVRIIALERLGRQKEAQEGVSALMRIDPGFTVDKYERLHPAVQFRIGQDWANALRSAGAPQY